MKRVQWIILFICLVLGVMIFNDFVLHLVEYLGIEKSHPFYSFLWYFPNRKAYNDFWTTYWGLASVLISAVLILLSWEFKKARPKKKPFRKFEFLPSFT